MTRTRFSALIASVAKKYDLDPDLLEAQVVVESSGDPFAFRFEPAFYQHYISGNGLAKAGQYGPLAACSFGLLQIMLETAMEDGFDGRPEDLFAAPTGLDWGAHRMRSLWDKAGGSTDDYRHALAAYNGGISLLRVDPERWPGGPLRYVNWVYHAAQQFPKSA